jgi:hypothetical protein
MVGTRVGRSDQAMTRPVTMAGDRQAIPYYIGNPEREEAGSVLGPFPEQPERNE